MRRIVFVLALMVSLSACGSVVAASPRTAPTASPTVTPSASPTPTATTASTLPPPAATPTAAPAIAPPPPPVPPRPRAGIFAIGPVGGSSVTGTIRVTDSGMGGFQAVVTVRGLAGGMLTVHTVHVHQGSCMSPYAGAHLFVLGLLTANAAGSGTLGTVTGAPYVGGGRYLIVYSNAVARTIVGCANLGPLS